MIQLLPEKEERFYVRPDELISLKDAGLRGGALAVRELDPENLERLMLSDPATWPAVLVTHTSIGYLLLDGYHRLEVATQRGLDRLLATCWSYRSENEVIEAAFRANLYHGLRASAQTRSDYAYWLHKTYPTMEQAEIAQRAGITQSSVSKAIARREAELQKARQAEGVSDEHLRTLQLRRSCRSFTRFAVRFGREVESLDDAELLQQLRSVVKRREDLEQLARLGRLLAGEVDGPGATQPQRLSQFAGPSALRS